MLVSPLLLAAQALAAGPHPVGWSDRSFDDPDAGAVRVRVYYPAAAADEGAEPDRASGPYPLAAFLHGWLGTAWMYDRICTELASWGHVVVSLDTETGLVLEMEDFADDAYAALYWTESLDPADPLAGLVADEDWIALGHSMGGATLGRLLGREPRISTAVAFMPYAGYGVDYEGLGAFEGSLLVLSGTHDTTAPPALQQEWMEAADRTRRSLLVEVTDMGHTAVTDLSFHEDPMPDDRQRAIVLALASTFVRAEHGGDEALWAELTVPPADVTARFASRSHDPALWTPIDGDAVTVGVAGLTPSVAEVFVGTGPELADAVSVAVLDLPAGLAEATIAVPPGLEDPWLAAETDDGTWTRAIALPGEAGPAGASAVRPAPDAVPPDPRGAGVPIGGCATIPGGTVGALWLAGLAARRRRG